MRRPLVRLALAAGLVLAGFAGFAAWRLLHDFAAPAPGPGGRERAVVEIGRGTSVRAVARELAARGVLRSPWPFLAGYRLFRPGRSIKAGEYEFHFPLSPREALETLIEGRVLLHPFTVPEGLSGREVGEIVGRLDFLAPGSFAAAFRDPAPIADWDPRAPDLEGYLFPETYRLPRGATPAELAAAMVAGFRRVFDESARRRAAELGMSVREVVTLASLIEKETGLVEERPLVSAVFHNRLQRGMKLDCDPTVVYAQERDGRYRGRLLLKDLEYPSPYNTYLRAGLPPGPICSPGRSSIEAALRPAAADFLYFVAKESGGHRFSRTMQEHAAAVQALRGSARRKPRGKR